VLIEGGAEILGQAFARKLVDRVEFHVAPLLTGGPKLAIAGRGAADIVNPEYRRIGNDLILAGDVRAGAV
jgi:riboflavin biosynthesis pyrimidine reductase